MVECTALEMRHTGNRIGGSNPSLSANHTEITRIFYFLRSAPEVAAAKVKSFRRQWMVRDMRRAYMAA